MINKEAIYSDGTKNYRIPCEPLRNEPVTIRIRVGREIANIILITDKDDLSMEKVRYDNQFAYYEVQLQLAEESIKYYFQMDDGEETFFYNLEGVVTEPKEIYDFTITPGFTTPDWAKGAVYYQIFVDRFYNGDSSNDVEDNEYFYIGDVTQRVKDWYKYPDAVGIREFYGGDLQGVIEKMDYLKDLGVEVLYFNPIFVSPSNHKYDTQDYDYVDPHFGVIIEDSDTNLQPDDSNNRNANAYKKRVTSLINLNASNELLIELVEKAHSMGIRVILDGVFNHCGSFHKWLDREGIYEDAIGFESGAYMDENSPYLDYFNFENQEGWPANDSYDGWWGHNTLPKLNYEGSDKLYEYILEIGAKWVSPPFNCDGWRLDVAADLGYSREFNHKFWSDFRERVKRANPDAIILAENYGDSKEWLTGSEWDTIMNYEAFMEPLTWFLTGMEKHSDGYNESLLNSYEAFKGAMIRNMANFQTSSLLTAMNELSNHDHSRFLTRTNKRIGRTASVGPYAADENINKGILMEGVTVLMTWPGAPTIYYGDEAGVCGWTDPDNRRTYPWGREDTNLLRFHKEMIGIHKTYEVLKIGSFLLLDGFYGVLSYGRFDHKDKIIIAVNNNHYEVTLNIAAWRIGITDNEMLSTVIRTVGEAFFLDAEIFHTNQGVLFLNMPPFSSMILKNVV